MTEPRHPLTDSSRSLGWLLSVFVLVIALFESGGLRVWAQRLEIGPWRSIALPVADTLHASLAPLGIDGLRQRTLANLQKLRRNDAPATAPTTVAATCAATPSANPWTLITPPASSFLTPFSAHTATPMPGTASAPAPASSIDTSALSAITLPLTTELPPLPAKHSDGPRLVALVGDSMMSVGLSATLLRGMAGHPELKPLRAFRSGTGLSRPEVFDWMHEYPVMLDGQRPEVIIVAIGANDGQGFVVDGKVLAFGTDEWIAVYEARLTQFLDMLTRDGARVIWASMPPMRNAKHNQRMLDINRIAYQVVSQNPHAYWWNITPYVGDPDGQFREFAQEQDGSVTRIRATDGIHLSDQGAALFTPTLLHWLESSAEPASADIHRPSNPVASP
ncbi:DUF459 domain-containing protein [Dyella tabacisoli]|uniref:DUF459 domain-containing protein n=1 Tax=Dyella tabacisoli TaxID=2282381 RepID=A0A369UMU8_9GAMM|nr:DUF459 domain-containing protein [Dyella tabacisoli]RDD82092.1 DUF459 domain-containing protein [Dyella tabacisoli]